MQPVVTATQTTAHTRAVAIEAVGLGKSFRSGFWMNKTVFPLKNCSLRVYEGETFGLLGPNGAGKTTLLKTLLGIVQPTTGTATLLGSPLGDQAVKARIGYLPENPYFYDYLTGEEILGFVGRIFELSGDTLKKRIPELLDLVGLSKAAGRRPLRKYSKGMLQRIGLAQALINDPELVFLDEPMSGLDPTGRAQIREIILQLKTQGKTVFFNSHILSDVEVLCDRVGLLVQGDLVSCGTLDELLGTEEGYLAEVRGADPAQLASLLANAEQRGDRLTGRLKVTPEVLLSRLPEGARLLELKLERRSLEDYFRTKVNEHQGRVLDT
jgi:ABC-2 type transport system ATP-binding protein